MSRDLLHIPVVVKGWDPAGVACWRVFCEACSGEISDYVSECKQKLGDDWPPPCLYDTHPLDDAKANCSCGKPVPEDGGAEGVCECCATCEPKANYSEVNSDD